MSMLKVLQKQVIVQIKIIDATTNSEKIIPVWMTTKHDTIWNNWKDYYGTRPDYFTWFWK